MKVFFLFLIAILPFHSFCQTLFGTTGGTLSDAQNQFDFSIGEPIVADVSGSNYKIGFQQPYYDFFTSVLKSEVSGFQIFLTRFQMHSDLTQVLKLNVTFSLTPAEEKFFNLKLREQISNTKFPICQMDFTS